MANEGKTELFQVIHDEETGLYGVGSGATGLLLESSFTYLQAQVMVALWNYDPDLTFVDVIDIAEMFNPENYADSEKPASDDAPPIPLSEDDGWTLMENSEVAALQARVKVLETAVATGMHYIDNVGEHLPINFGFENEIYHTMRKALYPELYPADGLTPLNEMLNTNDAQETTHEL
jgi:hypothetical protein